MARARLTPEERQARALERKLKAKAKRQAVRDWFKAGGLLVQVADRLGVSGALEFAFAAPERRWRFDAAWPSVKVALEIDGGTWMGKGGHTTGAGHRKDREKSNAAQIRGWMVLRVEWDQVQNGEALALVLLAIEKRSGAEKEKPGAVQPSQAQPPARRETTMPTVARTSSPYNPARPS